MNRPTGVEQNRLRRRGRAAALEAGIRRLLLFSLLAASLTPSPARAQRDTTSLLLRGVTLDAESDAPVQHASVHLLDEAGRLLGTVTTDREGRFIASAPRPGTYRLRAERIGYHPGESPPRTVSREDTVFVRLRLSPTPFLLDTVRVSVARATRPLRQGEELITGRLLDDETGDPIPYGTIRLLWRGKSPMATVLSRDDGTFRLASPQAGTYRLRGEGMGYRTSVSNDLYLRVGDTLDVDFRLAVDAVMLDPLTVNVSAKPWENRSELVGMDPFFQRYSQFSETGFAKFMTRDSLRHWQNRVQNTGEMLQWSTPMVRSADPITGAMTMRGRCSPAYYLNGMEVPYEDVRSFSPVLLEGIEVYIRPAIPVELGRGDPCGVVAYWSRQTPPDTLPESSVGRKLAIGTVIVGLIYLLIPH